MESLKRYGVAVFVVGLLSGFFYWYVSMIEGEASLSTFNNGLAMGTLFALGYILLLGSFARLFSFADGLVKYRKEIGIVTFFTGLTHVLLAMFPLARRGPFGFYLSRPWSAYPGLIALVIMFILLLFSFSIFKKRINAGVWWKMQYWGVRVSFVAVAVHMIVLKFSGWGEWWSEIDRTLPPAALIGTVFTAYVLVVRLSELAGSRVARIVTQVFTVLSLLVSYYLFTS